MVPAPEVICAVMHACRKLNDYALAVRFLESAEVNLYFGEIQGPKKNLTEYSNRLSSSLVLTKCCIPVDFPTHIDTISMVLLIVHFKESQIEFSK